MLKNIQPSLIDIVEAIALEIKRTNDSMGNLSQLKTVNRDNVVKAINSLYDRVSLLESPISDTDEDDESISKTWSAAKTKQHLNRVRHLLNNISNSYEIPLQNLKTELLTLFENKYVRYDASTRLSEASKTIARGNIGAADRKLEDVLDVADSFTRIMRNKLGYKNITGVSVTGDEVKTLQITLDNNTILSTTFNDININPTKFNSLSFDPATGILKAVNPKNQAINVLLDGRYVKISDMTQYVKTDDPRLTDARNAKDVKPWAKADTKPEYSWSEIKEKPELLKFGTEAQKGNVKITGNKIEIYNGVQWVAAEGKSVIVHELTDANKDIAIPDGKVFVVVKTTTDLEVTSNAPFLIYVKGEKGLKINTVEIKEGWAYVINGVVHPSHPYFDLLKLFNDTYSS